MCNANFAFFGQIGDGAAELEHTMIRPCAEVHLLHGGAHEVAPSLVELAEVLHLGRPHIAVDQQVGLAQAGKASFLHLARPLHPRADGGRRFSPGQVGQFLEGDARHIHMDVDAVHERPADALLVALHRTHRAGAFLLQVLKVAAGAGVHGGDEHKVGREGERPGGAADGDDAVFEWLAQRLQVARAKFGQFVQKEHAPVRHADLPWPRPATAAHQPGMADGVVRRPEGSGADQRLAVGERIGHRVDAGDIERLAQGQPRQDRW